MFKAAKAYFDASGHPDQHEVLTVAGFVSRVEKWDRFDREWPKILRAEDVSSFHATDYASGQGEYAKFNGDPERRDRFQHKLTECIKKNTNKAIRSTLILTAYREVDRVYKLRETIGPPYAVCAMQCLREAVEWARKKNCENTMICYFEKGDKDQGEFEKIAKRAFPSVRVECLRKHGAVAFQAAGFAAWKTKKNIQQWMGESYSIDQKDRLFESLGSLNNIPTKAGILTGESLFGLCILLGVERRGPHSPRSLARGPL